MEPLTPLPPQTPLRLPALPASPRVSVLIANYNYGEYVATAIESALAQTYANIEVIVCDDGSTDGSSAIIESYARDEPRVRCLRKENGGQASAWNRAYAESTGDIICPLDSDDTFAPEKIARVVEHFTEHPDRGFLVHSMMVVDRKGSAVQQIPFLTRFENGWIADRVVRRGGRWRYMPSSALAFRREVARFIFPIPETLRVCADAFAFTLAPLLTAVGSIEAPLSNYRVHGDNNISAAVYDLASARNVVTWAERAISAVNERLATLSLPSRALDPRHDVKFLETTFTIALLSNESRRALLRDLAPLMRALVTDDLYSVTQKLLGIVVYGGSVSLPYAARRPWLTNTLGLSRAKQIVATWRAALRRVPVSAKHVLPKQT